MCEMKSLMDSASSLLSARSADEVGAAMNALRRALRGATVTERGAAYDYLCTASFSRTLDCGKKSYQRNPQRFPPVSHAILEALEQLEKAYPETIDAKRDDNVPRTLLSALRAISDCHRPEDIRALCDIVGHYIDGQSEDLALAGRKTLHRALAEEFVAYSLIRMSDGLDSADRYAVCLSAALQSSPYRAYSLDLLCFDGGTFYLLTPETLCGGNSPDALKLHLERLAEVSLHAPPSFLHYYAEETKERIAARFISYVKGHCPRDLSDGVCVQMDILQKLTNADYPDKETPENRGEFVEVEAVQLAHAVGAEHDAKALRLLWAELEEALPYCRGQIGAALTARLRFSLCAGILCTLRASHCAVPAMLQTLLRLYFIMELDEPNAFKLYSLLWVMDGVGGTLLPADAPF